LTVLAAVLLALSAGVVAGVLVDARMTGVAQAATGDYTAFAWGSDGYFSGLKRGAKPVIDNETNESGVAAQNLGWENTPTIKFGKEGRFKDPSDSSRNADVSGNYKAIGIGPVTSGEYAVVTSTSAQCNTQDYCKSKSSDLLGGEALLFSDSTVSAGMYFSPNAGTVGHKFDSSASSVSSLATATKTFSSNNYSSTEVTNLNLTLRKLGGVCSSEYGKNPLGNPATIGCIDYIGTHVTYSTYSVFPLATGDFNVFLGYKERNNSDKYYDANLSCDSPSAELGDCGNGINSYWTRSATFAYNPGITVTHGKWVVFVQGYTNNPAAIQTAHGGQNNTIGLRPAARISLANLVVTTTSNGAQPVASSEELYLTFADSAKSLSNYAASFDGAVLTLQGTHTLDANKQLGWKIIEKGEEPEAVVASGRVTTSGADNSASVNLGALGLDTSKNYDIWYWGHKSGSATEGWSNTATVPQKFTIDTEDWEEPEPGVDLDKSAPVVSCPSDVSVVGYDRCAVSWDVVVSNTGGVALDGVVLSDRVSSVVDDVLVEVKEGGSGVLTASSTSSVVGGFVTRSYELPDVPVSGSVTVRVSGSVVRDVVDVVVVNQAWVAADGVGREAPGAPSVPSVAQVAAGSWDVGSPLANRWDEEPKDGVPGNTQCTSDADALGGVGDACDQVPAVIVHREVPVVPEEPDLDVDKSAPEVSCPGSGDEGHGSCAVSWDVRVSNAGNVALSGVGLSDRLSSSVSGVGVSETPSFTAVSAGGAGGVGLDARGRVWAWGDPVFSGDPDASGTGPWLVAEQAPVMQGVVFTQVAAGDRHVVALDEDGRVWSWGANGSYQSGDGTNTENAAQLRPRVMGVDYAAAKMSDVVFAQVAAGGEHSVAVDEDGRVWVWGDNAQRQSGDNSTSVTAEKVSPRVVGVDITGVANSSDSVVGVVFTSVSAGGDQTVALDEDGRVWRWGSVTGDADGAGSNQNRKPSLMSAYLNVMEDVVFTSVSAGDTHAVALDEDGRVWSWGNNEAGQSGDGTQDVEEENYEARVMGDAGYATSMSGVVFTSVSAGGSHSLAVDALGRVWSWGDNEAGQSGDGSTTDDASVWVPRVMGESGYATAMAGEVYGSVSAGGLYSQALDASGRLWSWGDGTCAGGVGGVLADGVSDGSNALSEPFVVSGVGGANRDAFERTVPVGLSSSLSGWTTRTYELGALPVTGSSVLVHVSGTVARGGVDVVVVNQAWATADEVPRTAPMVPVVPSAGEVAANGWDEEPDDGVPGNASCTSDADALGGVGDACDQVPAVVPLLVVPKLPGLDVDKSAPEVSCPAQGDAGFGSCVLSWDVRVSNTGGTALNGVSLSDRLPAGVTGVDVSETPGFTAVSAGGSGGVGLDGRGRVWAWGDPLFSGDPDASGTGPWLVAEQASNMQDVVFTQVFAGDRHAVALDAQGRVWSWGANGSYQSGDGTKTESDAQLKPRMMSGVGGYVAAMSGEAFVSVDAGATHSVALDEDGRVWVWGDYRNYQSGDNSKSEGDGSKAAPRIFGVDIIAVNSGSPTLSGVEFTAVSAGGDQTVALDEDGRVWRWGSNASDEDAGIGSRKPLLMSLDMESMQDVVFTSVSAGGMHAVALDEDGRVWSWGNNEKGQSGDGTQDEDGENITVRVMGEAGYATSMQDVGFTAVSAGGAHSLALDVSGRVWSWGSNEAGQSGDGTMTDGAGTWVPRVMGVNYAASMTGAVFASLSAGGAHAHALDATGRLWSWGSPDSVDGAGGVLADGQTLLTPRAVSGVGGSNREAFTRSVPPDGVPVTEGLWATRTYALGAIPVQDSSVLLRVTATATRVEGEDQVVVNQAWATADEKTRTAPTAPTVPTAAQVVAGSWHLEPGDGVPGNASCVTDADGGLGGADACDQVPGIVIMLDAPLDPNAPVTGLPYTGAFPWWLLILIVGIIVSGAGIAGMHHQTRLGTQSPNAVQTRHAGLSAIMAAVIRTLRDTDPLQAKPGHAPCRHASRQ
jgi:uncharacterized repeat protein (TIGR01451 family)